MIRGHLMLTVEVAGVLCALVAVMKQSCERVRGVLTLGQGVAERFGDPFLCEALAHDPAHDTPREEVLHYSQIERAFVRGKLGGIHQPHAVRRLRHKVLLQAVGRTRPSGRCRCD